MSITAIIAFCVGTLLIIFNKRLGNFMDEVNNTLPLKNFPKYGQISVFALGFILILAAVGYWIDLFRNWK
jgi:hypothetical protein